MLLSYCCPIMWLSKWSTQKNRKPNSYWQRNPDAISSREDGNGSHLLSEACSSVWRMTMSKRKNSSVHNPSSNTKRVGTSTPQLSFCSLNPHSLQFNLNTISPVSAHKLRAPRHKISPTSDANHKSKPPRLGTAINNSPKVSAQFGNLLGRLTELRKIVYLLVYYWEFIIKDPTHEQSKEAMCRVRHVRCSFHVFWACCLPAPLCVQSKASDSLCRVFTVVPHRYYVFIHWSRVQNLNL